MDDSRMKNCNIEIFARFHFVILFQQQQTNVDEIETHDISKS